MTVDYDVTEEAAQAMAAAKLAGQTFDLKAWTAARTGAQKPDPGRTDFVPPPGAPTVRFYIVFMMVKSFKCISD